MCGSFARWRGTAGKTLAAQASDARPRRDSESVSRLEPSLVQLMPERQAQIKER